MCSSAVSLTTGRSMCALLLLMTCVNGQRLPYSFVDVARLRKHILVERGLDSVVPPPQPNRTPTTVAVQLQIFKIVSVDTRTSNMVLKAWQRLAWHDPRLAWNVTDFGGVTDFRVHKGDHEMDNNLWTPGLHWYNAETQPMDTLDTGSTWVYSNGDVYQSRPGQISLLCRFSGLINFPYDTLSCAFDVGGWDYADNVQKLEFFASGAFEIDDRLETAGTSYSEYSISRYDTDTSTTKYACCPEEYTNLTFRIHFKRQNLYYWWSVEVPGVLLTLLSFSVFWLDAERCGERLGFGVTLLLAIEVTRIVINGLLPVCGEMLWVEILLNYNELFCAIALFESCFAAYVALSNKRNAKFNPKRADKIIRRIILPVYFIGVGAIYSIRMEDGYLGSTNSMWQGFIRGAGASLRIESLTILLLFPCAADVHPEMHLIRDAS